MFTHVSLRCNIVFTIRSRTSWTCSIHHDILWSTDTAWIRQGHAIDATGTRILHIKSEVLDTMRHDMLPILKYPCIIDDIPFSIRNRANWICFRHTYHYLDTIETSDSVKCDSTSFWYILMFKRALLEPSHGFNCGSSPAF